ncbi:hypothetical protein [Pacificibacter marinus]|uniref:hypothetical protein n=1 Tax=Pacificibacter marinus TaxID=658057 RepID=UPI001C07BB64|nr:hypothetical protein [Pacificibacter marinus]MBU2867138.1 hypothetical protein [Pacificibacter marinus]
MTQTSKAKASKAKTTPQPLPQTGGSFTLEKGALTPTASVKSAPQPASKPDATSPVKDA